MVAYLSHCLVEPDAARPSIETLLHAFLPAACVDHVHADAICSLANAPDPGAAVRDALGPDVAVVDYIRPGFELSKSVAELADARAVVLAHHGLVTWGETDEESYGLTIELVERAREYLGEPALGHSGRGPGRRRASPPPGAAFTRRAGRPRNGPGAARLRRPARRRTARRASEHPRPHAQDRRADRRAGRSKHVSSSSRASVLSRPGRTPARRGCAPRSQPTRTPRSQRLSTASAARAGSASRTCTTSRTGRSSCTSSRSRRPRRSSRATSCSSRARPPASGARSHATSPTGARSSCSQTSWRWTPSRTGPSPSSAT